MKTRNKAIFLMLLAAVVSTTFTAMADPETMEVNAVLKVDSYLDGTSPLHLKLGGTTALSLSSTAISPGSDNTYDLGGTSTRYKTIYGYDGDFSDDLTVQGKITCNEQAHVTRSDSLHSTIRVEHTGSNSYYPFLQFIKSRSGSSSSDDDLLGTIHFMGTGSGGGSKLGAAIQAIQNGASGANYVPTDLSFIVADDSGQSKVAFFSRDSLVMLDRMEPDTVASAAQFYCMSGEMRVKDGAGNKTLLSPHRFELYTPSSEDPLPWTYWSENRFVGLRVNADISGALRELEQLTGKQFLFYSDSELVDFQQWQQKEHARLIRDAKLEALMEEPEVEIPLEDAWEMVPVTRTEIQYEEYTEYDLDLEYLEINEVVKTREVEVEVPTGEYTRRLKPGVRFDPKTGKLYRQQTLGDIVLENPPAPPQLPQWVLDRMPQ